MAISPAILNFQQQRGFVSLVAKNRSLSTSIHSASQIIDQSYLPPNSAVAAGGAHPHLPL